MLTARPTERRDVVLPDRIWTDIDRNVHGVYRALEQLRAADLPCNRGLLVTLALKRRSSVRTGFSL